MNAFRLGIVGHEAKKFTPETEYLARRSIRELFSSLGPDYSKHPTWLTCVSGGCHLGGIDIWAIEEATKLGHCAVEHIPKSLQWTGGYRERNIEIAKDSDKVVCIVVKEYPPEYSGMRFDYCYHCGTNSHIKSGGCWTAKYAGKLGKPFEIIEL